MDRLQRKFLYIKVHDNITAQISLAGNVYEYNIILDIFVTQEIHDNNVHNM